MFLSIFSIDCHWINFSWYRLVMKTYSFSLPRVFMDKSTINKYLSNCTHHKYSFPPLRASGSPEYSVAGIYRWIFYTLYAYRNEAAGAPGALFADCETRQNISICLYIRLVRCIGNIAPRARSIPREISTPLRKRDISWIRRSGLRTPLLPLLLLPRTTFVTLLLMNLGTVQLMVL